MIGRVTSGVSGSKIQVLRLGRQTSESATVSRHTAGVQVGEQVRLFEDRGQLWVVAILGTAAVAPAPSPSPLPPVTETQPIVRGTSVVSPEWSGTFRSGSWRPDTSHLIQGAGGGWGRSWGAAFFPGLVRSLGKIVGGRVRLERLTYGTYASQSPRILLLGGGRTGAYPPILAAATGPALGAPGSVAEWGYPGDWLPRIASGEAGAIGVGVDADTPYMRFDGPEFLSIFDWERTS